MKHTGSQAFSVFCLTLLLVPFTSFAAEFENFSKNPPISDNSLYSGENNVYTESEFDELSKNETEKSEQLSGVELNSELGLGEDSTRRLFSISNNKDDVRFFLYYDPTQTTRWDELYLNDTFSIQKAKFKIGKPLKFIIHGFMSGHDIGNSTVPLIRNAYLSRGYSNIIGVDWSKLSSPDNTPVVALLSYVAVMQNVRPVGERVAEFIEFLIRLKIVKGPKKIHLIGHSLGAHVMGVAGSEIKKSKQNYGEIARISGLDPAGPLFNFVKEDDRLDRLDASFVDVIHTDIGMAGSSQLLGTVDFFANGGKGYAQDGCLNFTLGNLGMFVNGITGICSHARAYQLFARSIRRTQPELYGCRCRLLFPQPIPAPCVQRETGACLDKTLFGEFVPKNAKGNLSLDTKPASADL